MVSFPSAHSIQCPGPAPRLQGHLGHSGPCDETRGARFLCPRQIHSTAESALSPEALGAGQMNLRGLEAPAGKDCVF